MNPRDLIQSALGYDVTVVIRSVRERTESACIAAVVAQGIPEEDIVVINESPFSKALQASYVAGLDAGRKWTFCLDADVLLRPGAIAVLVGQAELQPHHTLEVQGLMLDKFTMAVRGGGVHLYRTVLLHKALSEIPAGSAAIRPETSVLQAMKKLGHPWVTVPFVIGIHDFGQYYEDIFRKCYVHANKHLLHIPILLPKWRQRAGNDDDFAVAIEGLALGLRERGEVLIDKRLPTVSESFARLGLAEKEKSTESEFTPQAVEAVLNEWAAMNIPVHGFPMSARQAVSSRGQASFTATDRLTGFIKKRTAEIGLLRTIPFVAGTGLEHLGLFIKRLAEGGESSPGN